MMISAVLLGAIAAAAAAPLQSAPQQPAPPPVQERVEVVATRLPEPADEVPAAIDVIPGAELRDRGARTLADALALTAGVDVTPGGDTGPAGSVPEFMGLREFDAFLLVVDGVPWGGAFNPALTTLSLEDVERIEVLRGPAPVTYGATSFVGVIHVVHTPASSREKRLRVSGGSYGSGGGSFSVGLPARWDSRLTLDVDRRGYRDDRTSSLRAHGLWRNAWGWGSGRGWLNLDLNVTNQHPSSPSPRVGTSLSPLVPVDANHNPADAHLDDRRVTLMTGFDRPVGAAVWTSTLSASYFGQDVLRGFLTQVRETAGNARGLAAEVSTVDIYADTHGAWNAGPRVTIVAGADYLHGRGEAEGATFAYTAPLAGDIGAAVTPPPARDIEIEDRRDFGGVYVSTEWRPIPRLRLDAGVRLNLTREEREGERDGRAEEAEHEEGKDEASHARLSGSAGAVFTAWSRGAEAVRLFASVRDTFKPAVADFNIGEEEGEAEGEGILEPETSRGVEAGVRARLAGGRVGLEASWFRTNFENLVVGQVVNGLPGLANAGTERFQGVETSASAVLPAHVVGRASYAFHDATFRDYLTAFDGVPTQLAGKRLEMSARHLASGMLLYAPDHGVLAGLEVKHVGSRYLTKRNTASAPAFTTIGAHAGYRTGHWEVRADASNLTDERAASAESELGESQYYRYPSRRIDVALTRRF